MNILVNVYPHADDIPIQAINADGSPATGSSGSGGPQSAVGNVVQLLSITEEADAAGADSLLGHRNAATRSSSGTKADTPKVHKAPFSSFMSKSKDKDKDKDKDRESSKPNIGSTGRSNGSLSGSALASAMSSTTSLAAGTDGTTTTTTNTTTIGGNSASSSVISARSAHRKDKFVNRSSVGASMQISGDSTDSSALNEKASPCSVIKRHLEFGTTSATSPTAAGVAIQMHHVVPAMGNGAATLNNDDVHRVRLSVSQEFNGDNGTAIDVAGQLHDGSGAETFGGCVGNGGGHGDSKRVSVIETKVYASTAGSMQVSQV